MNTMIFDQWSSLATFYLSKPYVKDVIMKTVKTERQREISPV